MLDAHGTQIYIANYKPSPVTVYPRGCVRKPLEAGKIKSGNVDNASLNSNKG